MRFLRKKIISFEAVNSINGGIWTVQLQGGEIAFSLTDCVLPCEEIINTFDDKGFSAIDPRVTRKLACEYSRLLSLPAPEGAGSDER